MKSQKNGYTLIELMIVLSIIAIVLMVTMPKIGSLQEDYKLDSAAKSCVMDLKYAQQLSMETKDEYEVYFDISKYEIKQGSTVIKSVNLNYVTFENINGNSSAKEIVFYGNGTPSVSGRISFKSNYSGKRVYVDITPQTGEVSENWS